MSHDASVLERKAEVREKVLRMYEAIVDNATEGVMARITAGDKLLDRIDGKAQANVNAQVSGADGGAINFTWLPPQ